MTQNLLSQDEIHALLRGDEGAAPAEAPVPEGTSQAVELPADLGIEQAASLHQQLASCLEAPDEVALAGGRVTRLHSAGLQVLVAFVRDRAAAGRATRWVDASPELRAASARLGVDTLLGFAASARP